MDSSRLAQLLREAAILIQQYLPEEDSPSPPDEIKERFKLILNEIRNEALVLTPEQRENSLIKEFFASLERKN